MKKLFFILLSSILLLSCSTGDDITEVIVNPGEKYTSELTVKISASDVQTKTVGYGDNDYVETKLSNALFATFFDDGSLNVIREASFAEGAETKTTFSLKPGNIKVYAVANINPALFASVNNESEFKAVLLSLNQSVIPLVGDKTVNIVSKETTKADIFLSRIVSKVSIAKIELGLATNGYPNATFKVDRVFLHGANTKSTIDFVGSDPKSGLSEASLLNYKADFFGYYDRHYFYTFQGSTKLIIGGWFTDGSRIPEYLYYPVPIEAVHNTHYAITAKINGKGVKNPDDIFEPTGKLEATLKVLPWNKEDIDVIFD